MTALGAYFGNDPSALPAYEKWLGRKVDNVLFYLNDWSWKDFDSSIGWATNLWKSSDRPVLWSVPLTVKGTSLAEVASGDYNNHFLDAAQALSQSKPSADGFIYVRVGWEFNGSWMPWAAKGNEAAFIGAFRELVDTFRDVSNKFKFVWDVNAGGDMNPETAYPGDAYVDVVGMDFYYNKEWDNADPAKAFQDKVNMSYGLKWQQDFAAKHGKETSVSEWGVKTDDSGAFVKAALAWMTKYDMLFQNYWESDYANFSGTLHDGSKPIVGGIFKDLFGVGDDTSPRPPGKLDLAPTVTGVAASALNALNSSGTAVVGQTVTLTLTLSKAVTVEGASEFRLSLNDGGSAVFDASASNSTHLVFRHTVLADQVASDLAVTGVVLNGALVRDASGNKAVFTDAVGNPNGVLKIDGYTGSAGNDVFRGTDGAETFNGRDGNDIYYVNHTGDKVIEGVKGGYDTVVTTVSYVLGYYQEVEKLVAANPAATTAINLEGNSFDQTLEGNAGNNILDGSAGADTLYGFGGNDTYLVDNIDDKVFEAKDGGYDTLIVSANYRLAAGQEIELIRFADSMASRLLVTGNEFNQTLIGNKNDNIIDGGAGNDIMTGGDGADTFAFSTKIGPGNVDRITDFARPDKIGLARSEFWNLSAGKLADNLFKNLDNGKVDADDRLLYKQSTGELFYDWDGSGKQAAILIGVLDNKALLYASDIFVF